MGGNCLSTTKGLRTEGTSSTSEDSCDEKIADRCTQKTDSMHRDRVCHGVAAENEVSSDVQTRRRPHSDQQVAATSFFLVVDTRFSEKTKDVLRPPSATKHDVKTDDVYDVASEDLSNSSKRFSGFVDPTVIVTRSNEQRCMAAATAMRIEPVVVLRSEAVAMDLSATCDSFWKEEQRRRNGFAHVNIISHGQEVLGPICAALPATFSATQSETCPLQQQQQLLDGSETSQTARVLQRTSGIWLEPNSPPHPQHLLRAFSEFSLTSRASVVSADSPSGPDPPLFHSSPIDSRVSSGVGADGRAMSNCNLSLPTGLLLQSTARGSAAALSQQVTKTLADALLADPATPAPAAVTSAAVTIPAVACSESILPVCASESLLSTRAGSSSSPVEAQPDACFFVDEHSLYL